MRCAGLVVALALSTASCSRASAPSAGEATSAPSAAAPTAIAQATASSAIASTTPSAPVPHAPPPATRIASTTTIDEADFGESRPAETAGLAVSVRDSALTPDGAGFVVTIALKNTSNAPIYVYQRWNSWGAYQWRLAITDPSGAHIVAVNPQMAWTRNGATAEKIAPADELLVSAFVPLEDAPAPQGKSVFVATARLSFPLRVRAVFDSHPTDEPKLKVGAGQQIIGTKDLWKGAIASSWIEVR